VQNCIDQQDVATFQFRARASEKNFAPGMFALPDVAYLFANKVANQRHSNLPDEIGGKNKSAIHGNYHIHAPALVGTSNLRT